MVVTSAGEEVLVVDASDEAMRWLGTGVLVTSAVEGAVILDASSMPSLVSLICASSILMTAALITRYQVTWI